MSQLASKSVQQCPWTLLDIEFLQRIGYQYQCPSVQNVQRKKSVLGMGEEKKISAYKQGHGFFSNRTRTTWIVLKIQGCKLVLRELRPHTDDLEMVVDDFEKLITDGKITFERHEHQNRVIDLIKGRKDTPSYGERHHWGCADKQKTGKQREPSPGEPKEKPTLPKQQKLI